MYALGKFSVLWVKDLKYATHPLWQRKSLVLLKQVVPALHDDEHVVDADPDGDEGEDVVGLVVLHAQHKHDAEGRPKTENAREHASCREVETNLRKSGRIGTMAFWLTSVLFSLPSIITVNENMIT